MSVGRPSLFTPEIRQIITRALTGGASVDDACGLAGVAVGTFYEWQAIGRAILAGVEHDRIPPEPARQQEFAEFAEQVKRAQASRRLRAVGVIVGVAQDKWIHRKTGVIRTEPPPPITWLNTKTGEMLFTDPTALDPTGAWEKEWSGETWELKPGVWQAAGWYLERSDPANWRRQDTLQMGADPNLGPLKIEYVNDWRNETTDDE